MVTTVYNGEPYCARAIPSILSQEYEDFEYIIVDDGSTDGTSSFLSQVARSDPRVRVFSPGRLGRARALNFGIEQATSDYIAVQDFDDISYPSRLAVQVDYLDKQETVAAIGAYYVLHDDNRQERYVRRPPVVHQDIVRAMAKYIPLAHTLVTLRKTAWAQACGYPEVEDIEDLRLWIRLVSLGWQLANVPVLLGEHWVHQNSYWHQNFAYRTRQASLRKVQREAISTLGLPAWMHIYPTGRGLYAFLPPAVKRFARRRFVGISEREQR